MPKPATPPVARSTPKRDRLLDVAADLFYREGFHATGIDRVLKVSGLAKMTLYHHFASKDELIVAALERRSISIANAVAGALAAAGPSPRKRLRALFDWHARWFDTEEFNGCPFIRAAGEYPDLKHPVHQAVVRQKNQSRAEIDALLKELDVPHHLALAAQINLLLQGAIVTSHIFGESGSIESARDAALILVKSAGG